MQKKHVRSHKSTDKGSWSMEEGGYLPSQHGWESNMKKGTSGWGNFGGIIETDFLKEAGADGIYNITVLFFQSPSSRIVYCKSCQTTTHSPNLAKCLCS